MNHSISKLDATTLPSLQSLAANTGHERLVQEGSAFQSLLSESTARDDATDRLEAAGETSTPPIDGSVRPFESDPSVGSEDPVREAFQDFVGQTFFSQMIASMRSTQGEPAYFGGSQAEKIFQGQFDQQLAEYLSDASAASFSDPMYKLFQLKRN